MQSERIAKVVVVGDMATGKTSIITKHSYDSFDDGCASTVGVDFTISQLEKGSVKVKLQYWDTAGQERFHALMPSYLNNCHIALIVYDISRPETFDNLDNWLQRLKEACLGDDLDDDAKLRCKILLVGNKSDLRTTNTAEEVSNDEEAQNIEENKEENKESGFIEFEKGNVYKTEKNLDFFIETSAKNGDGIKDLFDKISSFVPDNNDDLNAFLGEEMGGNNTDMLKNEEVASDETKGCPIGCF
eukprot:GAHX01000179.1.p1 GENE.GAHX01000179.1~~GAHX01000179.1.p1  ORF type:complete len:244 (+),score=65.91 GAHX01000179.1:46-777(+)